MQDVPKKSRMFGNLSNFQRWCVLETIFVAVALLGWVVDRDLGVGAPAVVGGLLLLPGFLWDPRRSRASRDFYNALIAILLILCILAWGRIILRLRGGV